MHSLFNLKHLAFLQLGCYLVLTRRNPTHLFFYTLPACQWLSSRVAFHPSTETCQDKDTFRAGWRWNGPQHTSEKFLNGSIWNSWYSYNSSGLEWPADMRLYSTHDLDVSYWHCRRQEVNERISSTQNLPDAIRSQRNDWLYHHHKIPMPLVLIKWGHLRNNCYSLSLAKHPSAADKVVVLLTLITCAKWTVSACLLMQRCNHCE